MLHDWFIHSTRLTLRVTHYDLVVHYLWGLPGTTRSQTRRILNSKEQINHHLKNASLHGFACFVTKEANKIEQKLCLSRRHYGVFGVCLRKGSLSPSNSNEPSTLPTRLRYTGPVWRIPLSYTTVQNARRSLASRHDSQIILIIVW